MKTEDLTKDIQEALEQEALEMQMEDLIEEAEEDSQEAEEDSQEAEEDSQEEEDTSSSSLCMLKRQKEFKIGQEIFFHCCHKAWVTVKVLAYAEKGCLRVEILRNGAPEKWLQESYTPGNVMVVGNCNCATLPDRDRLFYGAETYEKF